jgi:thioredoxin 1
MKIIKFEQEKCNPCTMVSNFLDATGVEYETIDAKQNPKESSKFGIMSVPVTILLDGNGNELSRVVGYAPTKLQEIIDQYNN